MDYRQFIRLMEPGEKPDKESIASLQEFVNEFPYFQTAQILLAKSMHEHQHVRYEKQLKIAAAYAGDRKALYNLIHSGKMEIVSENLKKETEIVQEKPEEIPVLENIFVDAGDHYVLPPSGEETQQESPVEMIYDIPMSVPHYFDDEPEEEETSKLTEDPHDIIRKRLNEILGLKNQEPRQVEPTGETIYSPEKISDETVHSIIKENDIVQPEVSEVKTESMESKAEEMIFAEDALEETILHSIEKLPPLDKQQISEAKQESEHSFYGWLRAKSSNQFGYVEEVHAYPEKQETSVEQKTPEVVSTPVTENINENAKLIDRFIKTEPRIVPSKSEFYSPVNQAKRSVTENEDLVSETLAKIYFQQGNLAKAISSYERLSLLYPEKKAYFAALISEVEKAINNLDKQDL